MGKMISRLYVVVYKYEITNLLKYNDFLFSGYKIEKLHYRKQKIQKKEGQREIISSYIYCCTLKAI